MRVVVLNDTRAECHHGCSRVMNAFDTHLKRKGVKKISYVPLGESWEDSEIIKRNIIFADIAIINGEGTIHHNSRNGFVLVKLAKFARAYDVKCFLVNATYESNDESYRSFLECFDGIFVRESLSKKELKKIGIDSMVVPDLTFDLDFSGAKASTKDKSSIYVTDSVLSNVRTRLSDYAADNELDLLSIFKKNNSQVRLSKRITRIVSNNNTTDIMGKTYQILKEQFTVKNKQPETIYSSSHIEYAEFIAKAQLVLCGRFHAMCYCMISQTPFLAISSNSHKVEGTLTDAGIDLDGRLIELTDLGKINLQDYKFNSEELDNLSDYKMQASKKIRSMFDDMLF